MVALVVVVGLVAGCSGGGTAGGGGSAEMPEPVRGGEVVVALTGESDGFNPVVSRFSNATFQVARAVMDPLVVLDAEAGWQPYLAESLEPNADFTVWTIRTRPGVRFHNGEALDAAALALFLDAASDSALVAAAMPERPTVAVVDDRTVTVSFTRPWSSLPIFLADQAGYVIAPEQLRSGATDTAIGTGPFTFERWVPDGSLRVVRNDDYWRAGLPYLDAIEFRPLPDASARVQAIEAGDVSVADSPPAGDAQRLAAAGFHVIDDADVTSTSAMIFNLDSPGAADLEVRRALVAAVDPEAFVAVAGGGDGVVVDQVYPPGNPWHGEVDYPSFDPDRARSLVEAHEQANGPLRLRILVIAAPPLPQAAEFVQQAWAAAGVDADIDAVELSTFIQRFIAGDYDAVYIQGFFGAADPDSLAMFLHSKAADGPIALNFARHRNATLDAALEAQRTTSDRAERAAQFQVVWEALAADLPYLFLMSQTPRLVTAPDVYLEPPTTPEGLALPAINRWTTFPTTMFVASG